MKKERRHSLMSPCWGDNEPLLHSDKAPASFFGLFLSQKQVWKGLFLQCYWAFVVHESVQDCWHVRHWSHRLILHDNTGCCFVFFTAIQQLQDVRCVKCIVCGRRSLPIHLDPDNGRAVLTTQHSEHIVYVSLRRQTGLEVMNRETRIITSNGEKLISYCQRCFKALLCQHRDFTCNFCPAAFLNTLFLSNTHTHNDVLSAISAASWPSSQAAVATETVVHGRPARRERRWAGREREREKYEQRNRVQLPPLLCLPIILRSHGHDVLSLP